MDHQNPQTLLRYFRLNRSDENAMQNGVNYFQNISIKMIIENARYEEYQAYFTGLHTEEIKPVYADQVKEIHHSLSGYYHYSNYEFKEAIDHLAIAYELNPKDLETKEMVKNITSRYVTSFENYETILDTLDNYMSLFPYLVTDKQTGSLKEVILSYLINNSYFDGDFRKGMQYIRQLEYYTRNSPGIPMEENDVVAAFSKASASYVRAQKWPKRCSQGV